MLFNGHTARSLEEISEEQFYEIAILFADGQLGSKAIYDALTPITSAVWGYMAMGKQQYTQEDFFPMQEMYFPKPKLTIEQKLMQIVMTNAMRGQS